MVHCLLIFNSTTEYSSVFSPRANFQQQTVIVRETGANLELQSASVIVDNGAIASCVLGTSSHGKPRSGRCKTTVRSSGKWGTWKCKRFEEQGRRWARGREFRASDLYRGQPSASAATPRLLQPAQHGPDTELQFRYQHFNYESKHVENEINSSTNASGTFGKKKSAHCKYHTMEAKWMNKYIYHTFSFFFICTHALGDT